MAAAPNQKVIMMPLEASGVIGAVAGIGELVRSATGGPVTGQGGGVR